MHKKHQSTERVPAACVSVRYRALQKTDPCRNLPKGPVRWSSAKSIYLIEAPFCAAFLGPNCMGYMEIVRAGMCARSLQQARWVDGGVTPARINAILVRRFGYVSGFAGPPLCCPRGTMSINKATVPGQ